MSLWQFSAAITGYAKQFEKPGEKGKGDPLSTSEQDELWAWMQAKDDVPLSSAELEIQWSKGSTSLNGGSNGQPGR